MRRLPLIVPVVFYHGARPCSAPLHFESLITVPSGLDDVAQAYTQGTFTLGSQCRGFEDGAKNRVEFLRFESDVNVPTEPDIASFEWEGES